MALPPIAVTEVALSGISRYYNISAVTSDCVTVSVSLSDCDTVLLCNVTVIHP